MFKSPNYRKPFRLSLFTSTGLTVDKAEAKQPLMRVTLTSVFHVKKMGGVGRSLPLRVLSANLSKLVQRVR